MEKPSVEISSGRPLVDTFCISQSETTISPHDFILFYYISTHIALVADFYFLPLIQINMKKNFAPKKEKVNEIFVCKASVLHYRDSGVIIIINF